MCGVPPPQRSMNDWSWKPLVDRQTPQKLHFFAATLSVLLFSFHGIAVSAAATNVNNNFLPHSCLPGVCLCVWVYMQCIHSFTWLMVSQTRTNILRRLSGWFIQLRVDQCANDRRCLPDLTTPNEWSWVVATCCSLSLTVGLCARAIGSLWLSDHMRA